MATPSPRVLLSWSSGKDSAWALHALRQCPDLEVVGLLTTFNEEFERVAMHAVRRELVEAQAAAAGLPLIPVMLPYLCTNEVYEQRMKAALAKAKLAGITHLAFGDLFLADPLRGHEAVNDGPRGRPRVADGEGTSRRLT
jgi:diphthamide synthase (EF-2-diphthine--ammonia ligase)